MALSKYNRDRPFLVVSHSARPSAGQKTSVKNFLKDAKWDVDESIIIVDRVSNKHMVTSSVIVDILKRSLVKSRYGETHSKEEVIQYYLKKYNKEIAEGIQRWMKNKTGGNKEQTAQLIKELEDELSQIEMEMKNEETKKDIN